jgi:hypothetical protein
LAVPAFHVLTLASAAASDMCTMNSAAGNVGGGTGADVGEGGMAAGTRGKGRVVKKITVTFMPGVKQGTATAVRTSEMAERSASRSEGVARGDSDSHTTSLASLARLHSAGDSRCVRSVDLVP